MMDEKLIYAFRGWIAFVAFMDMGSAVRCLIEKRSFLGQHSNHLDDSTLTRILGMYSILKALALVHCTLYIHLKPVVSLGICTLVLTILMYLLEVFIFKSTALSFYVIFPCVLNGLTVVGLVTLTRTWSGSSVSVEDENAELLRQATVIRRKKPKKVNLS